eukprot:10912-Heterococcus_DN1.PRE.2
MRAALTTTVLHAQASRAWLTTSSATRLLLQQCEVSLLSQERTLGVKLLQCTMNEIVLLAQLQLAAACSAQQQCVTAYSTAHSAAAAPYRSESTMQQQESQCKLASCLCTLVAASLRAPAVCHRTNMEDNQCQRVLLIGCQAAVTAYSTANSIVLQLFAVQILLNCTATQ